MSKTFYTLEEARGYVIQNRNDGVKCPCCDLLVKIYPRKIHTKMAQNLIRLYTLTMRKGDGYYHTNDFEIANSGGDFAKLRFFGLVEALDENDDPTKRTSGMWKITELGKMFVRNETSVPETVYILDNHKVDESRNRVTIQDKKFIKKFNYSEMMGEFVPQPGQQPML